MSAGVRRAALLLVAGALLAVPTAEAAPPQPGVTHVSVPPGTPPVEWGAQLFGANCITCHGPDGRGIFTPLQGAGDTTGLGPSLQGVGAQAADFYLRTGYMPLQDAHQQPRRSRSALTDREVLALVAYVASLAPGPAIPRPDPAAGNVSDGQRLFTDHCSGC